MSRNANKINLNNVVRAIGSKIEKRDLLIERLQKESEKQKLLNDNLHKENIALKNAYATFENMNAKLLDTNKDITNAATRLEKSCINNAIHSFITDIDYYNVRLNDINKLLESLDNTEHSIAIKNRLQAQKELIMGEYFFNNMLASNMSGYVCDIILK